MALITADDQRIGAHEQLRIYGQILGMPVQAGAPITVDSQAALAELRGQAAGADRHRRHEPARRRGWPSSSALVRTRLAGVAPLPGAGRATPDRRRSTRRWRRPARAVLSGAIVTKIDETSQPRRGADAC
ncbi:MAG: hypothetical protein MZV65_54575 [Chromatiales bacterium]|nr:hypothetical protein [Chromatiales bacterium]